MNPIIKTLALCAFMTTGGAVAAPVLLPNGDFAAGNALWTPISGGGSYVYDYPTSGGNPDDYGIIDNSGGGGFGIWVANGNTTISLASLGLTAGQTYAFSQDMITLITGSGHRGGVKIESWNGANNLSNSGDMFATTDSASWATYTFNYTINPNADSIKVVPLWGANRSVGYDNFRVDNTPVVPPPIVPVVPNGDFENGGASWVLFQSGGQTVNYPATGGNPNGHAVIDSVGKTGFAGINSNNNTPMTLASLGLTAGQTYIFALDMKILEGPSIGGLKVEFVPGGTGDMYPTVIGDGTQWATYSFSVTIPPSCTQIFVVPLWGPNSRVAYDNVKILIPVPPAPVATIASGTLVSWTAASNVNSYQPQESSDNLTFANLGAPVIGTTPNSRFDASPSAFYQVLETTPPVLGNGVPNPGFEILATPSSVNPGAENWNIVSPPDAGASMTVANSSGGFTPHSGDQMLVIESTTPAAGPVTPPQTDVRSDRFAITGGVNYDVSFYAANTVKVGGANPQYSLFFYNDGGGFISNTYDSFATVGTAWTLVSKTFTAPAGAASVTIGWIQAMGAGNGWQWITLIDDVSLPTPSIPGETTVLAASAVPSVEISFTTMPGSTYQVESSPNLATWADFTAPVIANGTSSSVTDAIVPPRKFYRVRRTTP